MSAGISSIKTERAFDHRNYFGSDYSIEDIQNVFDANGLECNYQKNVPPFFVHQICILTPWFGWKSTFTNTNRNQTLHKSTSMRRSSALYGKNIVKRRSHQMVD